MTTFMTNAYTPPPETPSWVQHLEAIRRQRNADSTPNPNTKVNLTPSPTAAAKKTDDTRHQLSEAERELAYQRYLQTWQHQHNLVPEAQDANTTYVMFGDEWRRDAEEILSHDHHHPEQTVLMHLDLQADVQQTLSSTHAEPDLFNNTKSADTASPVQAASYHFTVVAPPVNTHTRVALMDETLLLRELQEKLRPHLSDAVTGVIKTTIQRHLQTMIQELQQEIPQQLNNVIEEVTSLYLQNALDEIKTQAGIVKKVSS